MDPIKKIIGNRYNFSRKGDWDFDGVPDKKDCQPFNPLRQDQFNQSYRGWTFKYDKTFTGVKTKVFDPTGKLQRNISTPTMVGGYEVAKYHVDDFIRKSNWKQTGKKLRGKRR